MELTDKEKNVMCVLYKYGLDGACWMDREQFKLMVSELESILKDTPATRKVRRMVGRRIIVEEWPVDNAKDDL